MMDLRHYEFIAIQENKWYVRYGYYMLYSLIILLLLTLYDPGFACYSDNFMSLV